MATSSILGGTQIPEEVDGKDMDALGPSDNSDSGSDAKGAYGDGELASDSDSVGTGERAAIGMGMDRADADILPDHVEGEAGTGLLDDDLGDDGGISVQDLAVDDDDDDDVGDGDGDAAEPGRG
jgi:hypothetical protein